MVGLEKDLLDKDKIAVLVRGPKFCVRRILNELSVRRATLSSGWRCKMMVMRWKTQEEGKQRGGEEGKREN